MNIKIKIKQGILLLFLFLTTAEARIRIDITEGQVGAVPIAIPAFSGSIENQGSESQTISEIIAQDLKLSGRFHPIDPSTLPQGSLAVLAQYPAKEWQQKKVENVILGDIKNIGGLYQVQVELLDVFGHSGEMLPGTASSDNGTIPNKLLSTVFKQVSPKNSRALAHHISDMVFEKLTGLKGIFSSRIAYVLVKPYAKGNKKEYRLEIADIDGFNAKALVRSLEPIMSPAWSPDGKKIAYVSFEQKRSQIYVLDVLSGRREKITQFPGINGAPSWSPDGSQLALVLSKDGSPAIYTVNLSSRVLKRLTQGYSIDTEPSWDPKGTSLFFTSNRGGSPQIYKMPIDSPSQVTRVTFKGSYNARPSISSDGQFLVMQHRGSDGIFKIAKQHLQSGELTVLTQPMGSWGDESPSLSPNGDMILYGTRSRGQSVLGLVSLAGRGKMRLPAREGVVQEPAWSPYLSY